MRKLIYTLLLLLVAGVLSAEVITLKTGKVVEGTVLFENEEVVVIRDASGARFQYPKSDIQSRVAEAQPQTDANVDVPTSETAPSVSEKHLALGLELSEGVPVMPGEGIGRNMIGVDLLICSHHVGERRVMLGASVGYRGSLLDKDGWYSYMPLAAVVRYPILEGKHCPVVGASLGYGIALSKQYVGGVYAAMDVAYRYEINQKSALWVGLNLQCQQTKMSVTEVVEEDVYVGKKGLTMLTPGVKFGIAF